MNRGSEAEVKSRPGHGKTASTSSFNGSSFGGGVQPGQAHHEQAHHVPPPPLPRRRQHEFEKMDGNSAGLFVVPAPESEPTSPIEAKKEYLSPSVEEAVDEDSAVLRKKTAPKLPTRIPSGSRKSTDAGREEIPVVRA